MWSLTHERVDKLLRQISDKETEIDDLIKLSPKDLWTRDLDDFIKEWHFQLADEKQRKKKIAGMGRRASGKLGGIAGSKPSKRKAAADDDDSDFEVSKKKKKPVMSKGPAKSNSLLSYLNKTGPTKAVLDSPPATSVGATPDPAPQPKSQYPAVGFDGSSDVEMADAEPAKAAKAKPAKAAASKATKVAQLPSPDDDTEADVFAEVAEETKRPARQARAAARKPAKYILSDSESDGDDGLSDHLGDVSAMVKGIGTDTSSGASRTLFSNTARPSSGSGLTAKANGRSRLSTMSRIGGLSDDELDATDYTKLIPQDSPRKPAARTANETILSDDDLDEDSFIVSAKLKAKTAPAKVVAKKAVEKVPKALKPVTLSPAGKAYAAKQKAKAAAPKKMKPEDSEDEMVDELLSDEEDASSPPKPVARPGRRAASKPAKYVVSEDEDSFDEDSFVVDDESD